MQLDVVSKKYSLSQEVTDFMQQYGYDEACRNFVWPLPELAADVLARRCEQLDIKETLPLICDALEQIGRDDVLKQLFYYLHYYWYKLDNALIYGYKLPDLAVCAAENADILHLAIAISGCEVIEKKFSSMNIPEKFAHDALQRIAEDARLYSQRINRWGYPESGHHWMRFFVDGMLFRIGRFEYMIEPLAAKYMPRVYRHKASGALLALCRDNWRLNREGFQLWKDIPGEEPFCVAALEETADSVRGIPVNPAGFAEVDKLVTLDKSKFELFCSDSDLLPDMHIPPGGNMRPELCRSSLQEALKFFPEYLGREVKAFICFSWIFNPDFCPVMEGSNMSLFMRELYLSPCAGSSLSGLSFVFGREDKDWSSYPAENSLQRAFHQLRQAKRRLKTGGMFIEASGIEAYGSRHYQCDYAALLDSGDVIISPFPSGE